MEFQSIFNNKNLSYARQLFILTIITIFFCELIIMIFIELFLSISPEIEVLMDAILITVLIFPILYVAIFKPLEQDILERKKVEKALYESKEKYQLLVESMEEGVIFEDPRGIISYINPRIIDMVGYSKEEVIGSHWKKLIPPEELDKVIEKTVNRSQGVPERYETNILTKEGINSPVLVSANPIFTRNNDFNQFQGVLTVLTDISELKKLQQRQQRFVAAINHELRTPITIIQGYFDIMRKFPQSPEMLDKTYQKLDSNISRLSALIENIHALSKISQNIFRISPSQTDFEDFIQIIQDQCYILYPSRSIIFNYFNWGFIETIKIDQDKILQVIHNLVSNAVKNSPSTSVVEIIVNMHANELEISIQDQGAGIPFQHFFQLFRPYSHFQTQYSTKGSGLGLYIVKNIVLAHGGSVQVLSQEQLGSCFTIRLPG
ncbi:MAG: PAS domain-containing sensor histidine kinase [Candidatus Hodarchaeales archaeon]